ncbi:PEP/pyruvate-binding domain-containing protein [Winogradskyella maritima]|uniref:PEP/pyruvate-binding domain-containing protein n=1 Tax=Winogradskyella maritima TaxID=1517766 RepID=A0ABV8AFH1_9FLAO|nr:PEP/pyruvate-binding domain-containing protein [Winogradskyella maritima]
MKYLVLSLALLFCMPETTAQNKLSNTQIKALVDTYKSDIRGPYYRIKWFCEDGTIRDPKDPCPDAIGGGIQHASFKQSALDLRKSNHLFFGEILASNEERAFLDAENNYDRLKQYQLNKYLASVDDGWVLQKGQYYRGALQSEDEEAWGKDFFLWLLKDDTFIENNFYLLRQALKDIPHNGDSNIAQLMRSQSKSLSEDYEPFMDLRIKIHGQPEEADLPAVKEFYKKNASKLSKAQKEDFEALIETMETNYAPIDFNDLQNQVNSLRAKNETTKQIGQFIKDYQSTENMSQMASHVGDILSAIRDGVTSYPSSRDRLLLLDMSNQLEHYLLTKMQEWKPETLQNLLTKIGTLACVSKGTGLIETWEYDAIEAQLNKVSDDKDITVEDLNTVLNTARSIVEWSTGMVKANYQEVVDHYSEFEPMAYGYIDDRVRSSIALNFGETVSQLGAYVAKATNLNNAVMDIEGQGAIRGLNPGYAKGELVVVDGNPDNIEVSTNKIYIFQRPPHDLKPVAGIMTVSEGNLVSHVQLLARNLGIPNAALSYENLKDLKKQDGKTVFYAVSNKGNVILKTEDDMTKTENKLFEKQEKSKAIIEVPVDQIRLDQTSVMNMRDVDASDSGKLCGPKAANLGELKKLFPEQVVEGLIIPFGIFRAHMDQQMPGEGKSYWAYLNETFKTADAMKKQGSSEASVEAYQLKNLDKLHKAIVNMDLKPEFLSDIKSSFRSIFGKSMGNIPVFLRSDTNMEDLKEFTGAGLNLTLFNILDENEILNGVKRVWASAYTERSFKWRQKYLSNPENVFPSILIIPSVDVDYSGVMITKGINSGNDQDLTVAFSRGAGGAVDGQSAETRLITSKDDMLLAPARQVDYIRLPASGGTKRYVTTFNSPILNDDNIKEIRKIAKKVRSTMADKSDDSGQAYDVEFGFKDDKLWLFQIRPFVENKQAKSSEYLNSIAPKIDSNKNIKLTSAL